MPNYSVKVYEVYSYVIEIGAASEEEAKERVNELIETADYEADTYEYTLDPDEWFVWENKP